MEKEKTQSVSVKLTWSRSEINNKVYVSVVLFHVASEETTAAASEETTAAPPGKEIN